MITLGYEVKWNATGAGAIGIRFDNKKDAELFSKTHDYTDEPRRKIAENNEDDKILRWNENGIHPICKDGKFFDPTTGEKL